VHDLGKRAHLVALRLLRLVDRNRERPLARREVLPRACLGCRLRRIALAKIDRNERCADELILTRAIRDRGHRRCEQHAVLAKHRDACVLARARRFDRSTDLFGVILGPRCERKRRQRHRGDIEPDRKSLTGDRELAGVVPGLELLRNRDREVRGIGRRHVGRDELVGVVTGAATIAAVHARRRMYDVHSVHREAMHDRFRQRERHRTATAMQDLHAEHLATRAREAHRMPVEPRRGARDRITAPKTQSLAHDLQIGPWIDRDRLLAG